MKYHGSPTNPSQLPRHQLSRNPKPLQNFAAGGAPPSVLIMPLLGKKLAHRMSIEAKRSLLQLYNGICWLSRFLFPLHLARLRRIRCRRWSGSGRRRGRRCDAACSVFLLQPSPQQRNCSGTVLTKKRFNSGTGGGLKLSLYEISNEILSRASSCQQLMALLHFLRLSQ